MNFIKNSFLHSVSWIFLIFLYGGCKTEVSPELIETDQFIHTYPIPGNQDGIFILPLPEKRLMLIGNDEPFDVATNARKLTTWTIDEKGNLLSTKIIADSFFAPTCTMLKDGSVLMNSYSYNGKLAKINPDGSVAFLTYFRSALLENYGAPIESGDGYYLTSSCNGGATGASSNTLIHIFNKDGQFLSNIPVRDSTLGLKCLWFSVHKAPNVREIFGLGLGFPDWKGNWNAKPVLFLTHQKFDNTWKVIYRKNVILNPEEGFRLSDAYSTYSSDGYLLIVSTELDKAEEYRSHIMQFDDSLDMIWKRKLDIPTYLSSVTETPDNHYLVTGNRQSNHKLPDQPLVAKIDRDGRILWSKTYNTPQSGQLWHGIQTTDGYNYFLGHTNGFGKGGTQKDIFLLKTDLNGNLK